MYNIFSHIYAPRPLIKTGVCTTVRAATAREAGVSRHHGGGPASKDAPKTPRTITTVHAAEGGSQLTCASRTGNEENSSAAFNMHFFFQLGLENK